MAIQQPQSTDKLNSPDHAQSHRVIAIDDAASNESLTVDSSSNVNVANKLSATQLATPYEHTVTVAKSGGDYTTLVAALASITDNDSTHRYNIKMQPGIYTEINPIICKEYVDITGNGNVFDVQINATTASSDIFTGINKSVISKLSVYGATTAAGITFSTAGKMKITQILFIDCQQGAVVSHADAIMNVLSFGTGAPVVTMSNVCSVTAGHMKVFQGKICGGVTATTCFNVTGASSSMMIFSSVCTSTNITNGFYANDGGQIDVTGSSVTTATNAFRIGSTGSDSLIYACGTHIYGSDTYDLYIESATGQYIGSGTSIATDKISIVSGATVESFGYDSELDLFRFLSDLRIGRSSDGNSLAIGDGGSYSHHVKVVSYDGTSAYVDETSSATIDFPNTSANAALYFGNVNGAKAIAMSLIMGSTQLNVGASGSVVWEYYDGGTSSWLEFDIMATLSTYSDSFKNDPFSLASNGDILTIRDDQNIVTGVKESSGSATGWATTSVNGDTGYWIRYRIAVAITTSMVFSSVRLKGDYTSIRSDGTSSNHGASRTKIKYIFPLGELTGSAADQSIAVSPNITIDPNENNFVNGQTDAIFARFIITENMDMSCGITFHSLISTSVAPSGAAQTAILHLTYAKVKEGEPLGNGGASETTQAETITFADGDVAYKAQTIGFADRINVSDLAVGDSVYAKIERLSSEVGDDLAGNITVASSWISYRQWQHGSSYA